MGLAREGRAALLRCSLGFRSWRVEHSAGVHCDHSEQPGCAMPKLLSRPGKLDSVAFRLRPSLRRPRRGQRIKRRSAHTPHTPSPSGYTWLPGLAAPARAATATFSRQHQHAARRSRAASLPRHATVTAAPPLITTRVSLFHAAQQAFPLLMYTSATARATRSNPGGATRRNRGNAPARRQQPPERQFAAILPDCKRPTPFVSQKLHGSDRWNAFAQLLSDRDANRHHIRGRSCERAQRTGQTKIGGCQTEWECLTFHCASCKAAAVLYTAYRHPPHSPVILTLTMTPSTLSRMSSPPPVPTR
jgi:hypothetical protein